MRAVPLALILASLAVVPASATAAGDVLVIGDSLEAGTAPYLQAALSPVPVMFDYRIGRPSAEGVAALRARLRPEHETVVFDLGTTDDPRRPDALLINLAAARELAGDRCLVLATVARPALGGATVEGMNRTIERFVSETPGAQLADWHAVVAAVPGLLADRVHPSSAGYALRAQLIAQAVEGCLLPGLAGIPPPRSFRPQPGAEPEREARSQTPSRARAQPPPRPQPPPPVAMLPSPRSLPSTPSLESVPRAALQMLAAAAGDARLAAGIVPPEPVLGAE
jgi:hypothetical protein